MMKLRRFVVMICSVWSLLFIPYIASKFTNEVIWTGLDFLAMGILMFSAVIAIELILSKYIDLHNRIKYIIFVFMFFLLIWLQLAVGIF